MFTQAMKSAVYVLTAAAIGYSTTVNAAENCTAKPVSGSVYSIVNSGSGQALDVYAKSTQNGADIIQWPYSGGSNQHFQLTDLGNGYWSVIASHSGLSLDVYNWSQSNGGKIVQWPYLGGENQQWALKQSSNGTFNIVSRFSAKSLTVPNATRGSVVYQNTDAAISSQRWYLNPVGSTCGTSSSSNGTVSGFASQRGSDGLSTTTGGGNATPVKVTTCSALSSALSSSTAAVVQIPNNTTIDCRTSPRTVAACQINCPHYSDDPSKIFYRIPTSSQSCTSLGSSTNSTVNRIRNETTIIVKSNKTLEGMGANSKVIGANFYLQDVKNIIIRNLSISNVNPGLIEAGDGISMNRTSHVWLDHLSFSAISDGHIDMYASDNVTLSWNRFNGANSAVCGGKHHYTQIISDSKVTLHHNMWNDISGRNPKIIGSSSRVHLFSNFWKNVTYFSIGVGEYAQAKVEGNYFENAVRPHWNTGNGYIDANISSNRYTGVSATDKYKDTGSVVFRDISLYPYSLERDVSAVPNLVNNGAGPR